MFKKSELTIETIGVIILILALLVVVIYLVVRNSNKFGETLNIFSGLI